jgi:CheY-like chemotaxis protein
MRTKKFMLVDDDYDDCQLFAEAVGSVDRTVTCINALDGQEALEKLKANQVNRPDLIFLDINMPVMDGWQFLSSLKASEELRTIPVIMYSTSSLHSDVKAAMSSGALCFFTKPDSFLTLKGILQIVVEHMEKDSLEEVCDAIKGYGMK